MGPRGQARVRDALLAIEHHAAGPLEREAGCRVRGQIEHARDAETVARSERVDELASHLRAT